MARLFETEGDRVFRRRGIAHLLAKIPYYDRYLYGLRNARHSADALRKMLELPAVFGHGRLDECMHPVIVTTVNFSTGDPRLFKTPHHTDFKQDYKHALVDVALATSAAPIFLPHHVVDNQIYVDGGLVANGPALLGLHEAEIFFGQPAKAVRVLSIGTIETNATASNAKSLDKGVFRWGRDLFTLTIAAQERLLNQMLTHRLGVDRHMRIDTRLEKDQANDVGLDVVSPAAIRSLKGQAANSFQASINDPRLKEMLAHTPAKPIFHYGKRKTTL
jgi:predicted acylesterase/phospholipase RssA